MSTGAIGLGSKVSKWLGPPLRKMKMHDGSRLVPMPRDCAWACAGREPVGEREAEEAEAADLQDFAARPGLRSDAWRLGRC